MMGFYCSNILVIITPMHSNKHECVLHSLNSVIKTPMLDNITLYSVYYTTKTMIIS